MSQELRLPRIKGEQPLADYSHLRASIVQRRTLQRSQKRHLARLNRVKTSIDTRAPASYAHVHHNAKKAMMVDERYESIERQNRLLLERLQHIMLHDQGQLPALIHAGRVGPASLNEERRRREQHKLVKENEVRPRYDPVA
jgi:E3 ubiquitin-protein ligase TRIP12